MTTRGFSAETPLTSGAGCAIMAKKMDMTSEFARDFGRKGDE